MAREVNLDFSIKQSDAFRFLNQNDKAVECLYGGAKYGGKSYFGSAFCFLECLRLIKLCDIRKSATPIPIGFMGRMIGHDFRMTTLNSFFEVIPADCYKVRGKPEEIIIEDAVKIYTGGLDKQESINKFNSAQLAFFFIDQAEEVPKDKISLLRAATYWRLTINGIKIPGKGLFTANPRQCWLKEDFDISELKNPKDNITLIKDSKNIDSVL